MARPHLTPRLARAEEALTALFRLADDSHRLLNPCSRRYESLKKLSDSEVLTLALPRQLGGVESRRSFPRDAERFFSDPFPGVVGYAPSSFHRRPRKPRRFFEPPRRAVLGELVGDPETLITDSTPLSVPRPRRVEQSAAGFEGTARARWGSFAVHGVKPRLLRSTNRVPLSHELTAANVADVLLVRELLADAGLEGGDTARRLFGDLAYRGGVLGEELADRGILLATERAKRRPAVRQQVEVCFAALKRVFGPGETLAKTLAGLVTRVAAKVTAYTHGLYVNGLLGNPQGRIKEPWARCPRNTHLGRGRSRIGPAFSPRAACRLRRGHLRRRTRQSWRGTHRRDPQSAPSPGSTG